MFAGLSHAVLDFVRHYGYLAVFLYMVLETSFILHFVPSELVVPFAASQLVHGPVSFGLFVLDTTVGATVGSVLAYLLFGRYGRTVLERYGHVVHVSERSLDRSQTVFLRYGESSVFWGRMLPLLRALISVPAGLAEMPFRRFTLYSAAGAAIFNVGLTYLVYTSGQANSPLTFAVAASSAALSDDLRYVAAHTRLVVVLVGAAFLLAWALWLGRDWILAHPAAAKTVTLHLVRAVGFLVGVFFLVGALSTPRQSFALVTSAWNDPLFFAHLGFSAQLSLLLTGLLVAMVGAVVFEVGTAVPPDTVRSAVRWLRNVR